MAQFTVCRNPNPQTRKMTPYLLDVQNDLLSELRTRVVVPLSLASAVSYKLMASLIPSFELEGQSVAMLTPQLAGISRQDLGEPVADWSVHRDRIVAALDFLITGI